ncbi:hypothetical protein HPB52_003864 [Rhipicephalus sanguineus]|uniref:CCHC-type domain-containing protein n=1 Tax=Rhipicephalus sanguineus TaxID=34632 RepID=A0A9D4T5C7_RHISA|nr:hypothetical protein HPB52_003864 [Rhipicephalus sanguineus]
MDLIAANAFVDAINNRNVQRFVRLARPIDVPSALAVALEAEIQERSQAAEGPYRRPTYTDVPSGDRNSPARLHEPTAMFRCYHCNDVGHFARNCPGMSESLPNSVARAKAGPRMMTEAPLLSLGPYTEMPTLPVKLGDSPQHVEALVDTGAAFSFLTSIDPISSWLTELLYLA